MSPASLRNRLRLRIRTSSGARGLSRRAFHSHTHRAPAVPVVGALVSVHFQDAMGDVIEIGREPRRRGEVADKSLFRVPGCPPLDFRGCEFNDLHRNRARAFWLAAERSSLSGRTPAHFTPPSPPAEPHGSRTVRTQTMPREPPARCRPHHAPGIRADSPCPTRSRLRRERRPRSASCAACK